MAVKKSFGGAGWFSWEEDIKLRKAEALAYYRENYKSQIGFYRSAGSVFGDRAALGKPAL